MLAASHHLCQSGPFSLPDRDSGPSPNHNGRRLKLHEKLQEEKQIKTSKGKPHYGRQKSHTRASGQCLSYAALNSVAELHRPRSNMQCWPHSLSSVDWTLLKYNTYTFFTKNLEIPKTKKWNQTNKNSGCVEKLDNKQEALAPTPHPSESTCHLHSTLIPDVEMWPSAWFEVLAHAIGISLS